MRYLVLIVAVVVSACAAGSVVLAGGRVTCRLTGEQVSGRNKICVYDCLGSAAAITIRSTQLCPLSIQR